MLNVSDTGIAFIKHAEGLRTTLYNDAGHFCIGYGCDLTPTEAATYTAPISEETADLLLRQRLSVIVRALNGLISEPIRDRMTQNQFDALCSFTYNVGIGAFRNSTIRYKLNAGESSQSCAEEFERWHFTNGQISDALLKRRQAEAALFLAV